jgi:hypothetical protein
MEGRFPPVDRVRNSIITIIDPRKLYVNIILNVININTTAR